MAAVFGTLVSMNQVAFIVMAFRYLLSAIRVKYCQASNLQKFLSTVRKLDICKYVAIFVIITTELTA